MKNLMENLYVCALCGSCREVCPVKRMMKFETYSPRGKILTHKHYLKSEEALPKDLVDNWYFCSTCGYCREVCPAGIDFIELVKGLRTDFVKNRLGPPKEYTEVQKVINQYGNPFGKPTDDRANWLPVNYKPPKKAEYVYMAGCYASYWCPEIATSIVNVLQKIKLPFALMGSREPCCGMVGDWGGDLLTFRETAEKNVKILEEIMSSYGATTLFTSCPGCYTTIHEEYPKIVGKLDFTIVHLADLFARLIDEGKIKFKKRLSLSVTYQDPCHIGRFHSIYESPRKIIETIPGVKLLEMDHTKNHANCCGGLLRTSHAKYAINQAKFRSEEARQTGASTLLTFCPMCFTNLRRVAKRANLETLDIPMLMEKAI